MDLHALGAFLHTRRDRLTPPEVGLPSGERRRVPGLRRDEVAGLAGASVDYYTELERGRGAQPSTQVLLALSRALRLDADEHDHLFHLAGQRVPPASDPVVRVQPTLLALLDRLDGTPAQILTDLHETLVQNPLAVRLVGAPEHDEWPRASFLYRWFTEAGIRGRYPEEDHAHHSRVLVFDLRAAVARRGFVGPAAELVAELRGGSPEFAALWDTGDVAVRRGEFKRINHPELGVVQVRCQNVFSEDGRQRLQFFTAPDGAPEPGLSV
ncbi:transcriptional regulator with XRE-family HTH domain [Crossiella equi]|uniref:Transcriptional regulator with XRE-family HTH domain n=1 Tax=Crossiella equi TaxID=130796 RepID=A0ABS5AQJ0_9PSEU|nr:helix-turn-helix transcriptional regulator [Crossiella equi]MBP2478826.1 transcriptional regulator with XRE-family HTH domain [Crossiella equi]